jgi:hypothetical protein
MNVQGLGISACMIVSLVCQSMIQGHSRSVLHYTMVMGTDGGDIKLPLDRHENPTYRLFYMHPEVCVYDKKIQALIFSTV